MSIRINKDLCQSCGACLTVCPGDLIILQDKKASLSRPHLCWGCLACLKQCPHKAMTFYLHPSLGGLGMALTVQKEGAGFGWHFFRTDFEYIIETDPQSLKGY
jgi:adenylylsulfate reductase subunit B